MPAADTAKRFGVLIASSSFPDDPRLPDLVCPENDVDGLQKALGSAEIGAFSDVLVVKNRPSHETLRAINRVLNKADRDDLVLIFYAGHGKLDRAGRLHLATRDTITDELGSTSVPVDRIRSLIDTASTRKTVLMLDCCYSGAIEGAFLRGGVDDQLNMLAGGRGIFIMTAATGVQTATENVVDGYGLFTKHILDGVSGAADVDGDGVVTMNELYNYVHRQVRADSHQVPMKWDLNVEGELVIAKSPRRPRAERRLAVRKRLFDMSHAGSLPDLVLKKALEVSDLSFAETRAGAAGAYDRLLDRLLKDELRVGDFINEWLQVPPDDGPAPPPDPAPAPARSAGAPPEARMARSAGAAAGAPREEPAATPRGRASIWKPAGATPRGSPGTPPAEAARKPRLKIRHLLFFLMWAVFGLAFMGAMIGIFVDAGTGLFGSGTNYSAREASGAFVGAAIWAASGLVILRIGSARLHFAPKALYWLGTGFFAVLAVVAFTTA